MGVRDKLILLILRWLERFYCNRRKWDKGWLGRENMAGAWRKNTTFGISTPRRHDSRWLAS